LIFFKRLKREELKNSTGGRNRCYDSFSKLLNRSSFSKSQKVRSEQRASALSYTPKPFTKEEENALVLIMREEVPRDAQQYHIQRSHDRCIAWTEVSKRFNEVTGGCNRAESSLQTKWNTALRWEFNEDLKLGRLAHQSEHRSSQEKLRYSF